MLLLIICRFDASAIHLFTSSQFYRPVEVQETLPALRLKVLDVLRLVEDQVPPRLAPERLVILQHQLVGSDANVERVRLSPALREGNGKQND